MEFVEHEVASWLTHQCQESAPVQEAPGNAWLLGVRKRWEQHKTYTEWLRRLFSRLDGEHVPLSDSSRRYCNPEMTITSRAHRLFATIVFDRLPPQRLTSEMLLLVLEERSGAPLDRGLPRVLTEMLCNLGAAAAANYSDRAEAEACAFCASPGAVYHRVLEAPLLEATRTFYEERGREWIQQPVPEFARRVDCALREEEARVHAYLHASSLPRLIAVLESSLIAPHVDALFLQEGSGINALLEGGEGSQPALIRVFEILRRLPGGTLRFAATLKAHIKRACTAVVKLRGAPPAAAAAPAALVDDEMAGAGAAPAAAAGAGGDRPRRSDSCEDAALVITGMLRVHALHKRLVAACGGDRDLERAMIEAFEVVCNESAGAEAGPSSGSPAGGQGEAKESTPSMAHTLVAFLDGVLRGRLGKAKLAPAEIDSTWRDALRLHPFLLDKDIFIEAYKQSLAKRLLSHRTESMDNERALLGALKSTVGHGYTSKAEVMLHDLERSEGTALDELLARVAAAERPAALPAVDFSVTVLTQGIWPPQRVYPDALRLPAVMRHYCTTFAKAFAASSRKKLTWLHGHGRVELRMRCADRPRLLSMMTLQAVALLTIEEFGSATIEELSKALACSTDEAKRIAATMCSDPRNKENQLLHIVGALPLEPPGGAGALAASEQPTALRRPKDGDTLVVNDGFRHPNTKVVFATVDFETTEGLKRTVEDRQHVIDAALIRALKARKKVNFQDLVGDVGRQLLYFRAEPRDIKKRLECLIDREYAERDAADRNVINYVA